MSINTFADLNNMEIFRAGTWNGDTYSIADLDEMVLNFDKLKGEKSVPLKLGHTEKQKLLQEDGLPAAGWLTSLKRVGDKILADARDVPQRVFDLIQKGSYRKVSSEIYPNWQDANGGKYKNVLRAVALLGSDVPAVSGLADIQALYDDNQQPYRIYCTTDVSNTKMSFLVGGVGGRTVPVSRLNSSDKFTVHESMYSENFQKDYSDLHKETMKKFNLSADEATFRLSKENKRSK